MNILVFLSKYHISETAEEQLPQGSGWLHWQAQQQCRIPAVHMHEYKQMRALQG